MIKAKCLELINPVVKYILNVWLNLEWEFNLGNSATVDVVTKKKIWDIQKDNKCLLLQINKKARILIYIIER